MRMSKFEVGWRLGQVLAALPRSLRRFYVVRLTPTGERGRHPNVWWAERWDSDPPDVRHRVSGHGANLGGAAVFTSVADAVAAATQTADGWRPEVVTVDLDIDNDKD